MLKNAYLPLIFFPLCICNCNDQGQSTDAQIGEDLMLEDSFPGGDLNPDVASEDSSPESAGETNDVLETAQCNADEWIIVFPPNLRLCQWNGLGSLLPPNGSLHGKIRISILERQICWPRSQEFLEIDLIEKVEVSPDGAIAQPTSTGVLRLQTQEIEGQQWIGLNFAQEYTLGSDNIQASFGFFFLAPKPSSEIRISDLIDKEFNICEFQEGQSRGSVTAKAANGDQVSFDYFFVLSYYCPPGMVCLTPYGLGEIQQGTFVRDDQTRVVDSYFRMGPECMHHGGPNQFLMIFNEPIDKLFAIHLMPVLEAYQIRYLDQSLDQIEVQNVVDITWDVPRVNLRF